MANTLKVKRSSVQGKVPLTSDVQLGELAVNTYDGKLYLKKDVGGVESIVDVSAGLDATGVLQLLKTVDGVGSGLDADLLDGLASSSANTASTIVSRDSSGNFSAGTITAALSGNASTATTLQTARTINGVSFNGSANITIADSTKLSLSGGTMTGAITFAAGQTWPTFNQNTTGSAANISNTGTVTLASATESNSVYITAPTYSTDKPVKLLNFDWYGNIFSIGNIRSDSVASSGFGLYYTTGGVQTEIARFGTTGSFNTIGAITQNGSQVLTAGNYNSYSPTLTGAGASGTWGINVTGNAATVTNGLYSTGSYADPAWITSINYSKLTGTIPTWNQNTTGSAAKWTTARTLSFTGDATGSGSVDGSTNVATALTLANSGVAAGTYTKITVDAKGRATSGTTLADTDIPALDASKITTGVFDPARLPSYVDDVLEYANLASFPTTGTTGKIYVALDTNKTYRWSGTVYVYITSGAVDSVAGKTGVVTLTNADVGLGNVENKSSATIRGEITSTNVTSALGFTPYNSTNPNGYITSSGSISGSAGSVSGLTLTSSANSINPDNVTQNQIGYNTNISLFGQSDGGLYSSAHSSSWIHQIYGDFRSGQLAIRGKNNGTWQAWRTVLDSSNYTSYSPSLTGSGASGTWGINITGNAATASNTSSISSAVGSSYTWTGVQYFQSNLGSTLGGLNSPPLQAYATGTNAAFMSFHRGGAYAVNMGLDSDNVFRIGGWSAAANRFQMDMSGNLTMAGNVTAYSDEKLKKDWDNLPNNFIELLSKIKYGTYTRIDSNERQVGVSAQSLQKVLPEAVLEDAIGTLAVSYGNAAMVSVVELAKEVVELKAQIAELKALIMEK